MSKIIEIENFKITEKRQRILSIDVYECIEDGEVKYRACKRVGNKYSEQFLGYCVANVLRDIVAYSGYDNEDIEDAVEMVVKRLSKYK